MGDEYSAKTGLPQAEARTLVLGIIKNTGIATVVHETASTIVIIYGSSSDPKNTSWGEDARFTLAQNTLHVLMHATSKPQQEELLELLKRGFEEHGIQVTFEEE